MAFIASYHRETPQRYRYEGNMCKHKGRNRVFFPPRRTCDPWADCKMEPCTIETEGKVLTYTVIHVGPTEFTDETPYILAILGMKDGARLTTQLVDCPLDKVKTGMRVRLEYRKIQADGDAGILMYGYKAVPA